MSALIIEWVFCLTYRSVWGGSKYSCPLPSKIDRPLGSLAYLSFVALFWLGRGQAELPFPSKRPLGQWKKMSEIRPAAWSNPFQHSFISPLPSEYCHHDWCFLNPFFLCAQWIVLLPRSPSALRVVYPCKVFGGGVGNGGCHRMELNLLTLLCGVGWGGCHWWYSALWWFCKD